MRTIVQWAFWLYWCGVIAFGANFLLQIGVLIYKAYRKPGIRDGQFRIVELDGDEAPCSFGNTIFINPAKYDWETYNQILMHEKVHAQQGHSLDLMIAELMLVLQWFNPFAWLYRKEMESNMEFLTDDAVLKNHKVAAEDYQMSLLKVSVPNYAMRITTNYNQSLLKRRIMMMNTKDQTYIAYGNM
ncbi:M56 family metallopeptidase [Mucilaginibacter antarcticus]|uniref:M56 family metallopeptidase n=1 Tax=Mucilaginibacter antarcticus TaxID=1855725 RepID=UPI0036301C07